MSEALRQALGGSHEQIERALRLAQTELLPLQAEVRLIETLMAQARGILDLSDYWVPRQPFPGPTRPITLHQAIKLILRTNHNRPMTTRSITAEIHRRGLYLRRDGTPPTINDVSARISAYAGLFRREYWRTRLRGEPVGHPLPVKRTPRNLRT